MARTEFPFHVTHTFTLPDGTTVSKTQAVNAPSEFIASCMARQALEQDRRRGIRIVAVRKTA